MVITTKWLKQPQSNVYVRAFLRKYLTTESHQLFLQEHSIIDFWQGLKYASAQVQKKREKTLYGFVQYLGTVIINHKLKKY